MRHVERGDWLWDWLLRLVGTLLRALFDEVETVGDVGSKGDIGRSGAGDIIKRGRFGDLSDTLEGEVGESYSAIRPEVNEAPFLVRLGAHHHNLPFFLVVLLTRIKQERCYQK